jgi:hypothetical protein
MDGQRFDAITRLMATGHTRRRVIQGLLAAAGGGLLGAFRRRPAQAACAELGAGCARNNGCCSGACCAGTCVDPVAYQTDALNCGKCGRACPAGKTCCGGTCVDLQTNETHCGACDQGCDDKNVCTKDVCQEGVCTHTLKKKCPTCTACDPASGACIADAGQNGASCNDGDRCTTDDVCIDGICRGTPVVCTPKDECHLAGICRPGSGACTHPAAPAGTPCGEAASCIDGVATTQGTCKANGTCRSGTQTTCAPYACGATACLTSCQDASDCTPGNACIAQRCVEQLADGQPCGDDGDCRSGHCADGVCCDTVCTEQCAACNLPGGEGTCSPVTGQPVGRRPACAGTGMVCGGTCDGSTPDTCAYPSIETVCMPASCVDGIATPRQSCDGHGGCIPGTTTSCAPYLCGDTDCLTGCAGDHDCIAGHYCANTACLPQLPAGEVCTGPTACASGFCVDGICCADAQCTPICPAGEHDCGDGCVDLTSHRWNCGACGRQCGNYEHCQDADCVCETHPDINHLPAVCADTCTDLSRDRWHCGACAVQCDNYEHCRDSICACAEHPEINRRPALCADRCTDLDQDRWHCGACDRQCGDEERCQDGVCIGACPDGAIDVRTFGAIGNGDTHDTDDTEAIQAAIDAAAGGGTVCFPPGTYRITRQIALASGVTLVGDRPTSRIKCDPVGDPPSAEAGWEMLFGGAISNVTIRGLVIYSSNDQNAATSAIVFHPPDGETSADLVVEDCEIWGFKKRGIRSSSNQTTNFVKRLRVEGCHIHDLGRTGSISDDLAEWQKDFGLGVQPNGCDEAVVTGNLFVDIGTTHLHWGVYATDTRFLTVAGNTFRRCAGGIAIAGNITLEEITIRDNVVDGTTDPAHLGINLTGGAQAVVTGNRLGGAIILAAACADSEIRDNVLDLQQMGNSERAGILVGTVAAERVAVMRNRIFNGSIFNEADPVAGRRPDRGIRVLNGIDITIAQNEVSEVFDGIMVRAGGSGASIQGVMIEENAIRDTGGLGSSYVHVSEAHDVTIRRNDCTGGTPAFGIAIQGTTTSTIRVLENQIGPGPTNLAVQVSDEVTDIQVLGNVWRNPDPTPVPDLVR